MMAAATPTNWVWVSCSRDTDREFYRTRHLIREADLPKAWVNTACQATAAGEGTFRRDNRKPKCERCDLFAAGFAEARKEKK